MAVREVGRLKDEFAKLRRGIQRGGRDFTLEALRCVKHENPVDTGRSQAAWEWRFNKRTLKGMLGNPVWYIRLVAEGGTIKAHDIVAKRAKALRFVVGGKVVFAKRVHIPQQRIPRSAKERRNLGFHVRGVNKAVARLHEIYRRAFRAEGVRV